jgi:hypothetical protein
LLSEQLGNDYFHSLLLRQLEQMGGDSAEMMQEIGGLLRIPPAQRFDRDADLFEGGFGLLDLDLRPAVRQEEGHVAIENDLHREA